ncbi:tRNA wybutosine-synthesizing protein 2 [Fusarium oxysporum f. sp. albedinis]|nr:tRNA wybutosine-synthesizing protein 2 [Fusarium oxysporum f. sp. albedinis]
MSLMAQPQSISNTPFPPSQKFLFCPNFILTSGPMSHSPIASVQNGLFWVLCGQRRRSRGGVRSDLVARSDGGVRTGDST